MGLFIIWLIFAVVCGVIAEAKNRSKGGWFVLGLLFGIFALLAILFMSSLPDPSYVNPGLHPQGGWYADPWNNHQLRWHDGIEWTPFTTPPTNQIRTIQG